MTYTSEAAREVLAEICPEQIYGDREEEENIHGQCTECCKFTSTYSGAIYYPARGTWHYEEPADEEWELICPACLKKRNKKKSQ
jgi:hypothetical protein